MNISMDDFFNDMENNIDLIDFMSDEEKKEFIRKLITEEHPEIEAAFFNPNTEETITFQDIIDRLGEEKAIEAITDILFKTKVKSVSVSKEKMYSLMDKIKRGEECTEDEKKILKAVNGSIIKSEQYNFLEYLTTIILDVIDFAQTDRLYFPTLADIFYPFDLLATTVLSNIKSLETSKYSLQSLDSIADDISEDILNTWKSSCNNVPSDELIILALLMAIRKFLLKSDIKMLDSKFVTEFLGLKSVNDFMNKRNGSNDDNDNIRDLLKD